MYKWDRTLYTEKLLRKNSINKIFTMYADNFGYGWFIRKKFNRKVIYINGRSPGFSTYLARYIDDDMCIIVLGNN
ncbi:hypothetical protein DRQ09_00790 [candidate division KSB1 bacterium]|nr:MAG: hypothetical protein DRQ09_00790 [candidate division KSB1 bacterium]